MEQITIKLPPKMLEELKSLSEESYNPVSYYIREAIADYLNKNKNYENFYKPYVFLKLIIWV